MPNVLEILGLVAAGIVFPALVAWLTAKASSDFEMRKFKAEMQGQYEKELHEKKLKVYSEMLQTLYEPVPDVSDPKFFKNPVVTMFLLVASHSVYDAIVGFWVDYPDKDDIQPVIDAMREDLQYYGDGFDITDLWDRIRGRNK